MHAIEVECSALFKDAALMQVYIMKFITGRTEKSIIRAIIHIPYRTKYFSGRVGWSHHNWRNNHDIPSRDTKYNSIFSYMI